MSRLGKKPLAIPDKVKVECRKNVLEITGPLGKIQQVIPHDLTAKIDKGSVTIEGDDSRRDVNMLHGLIRGLVKNAFEGVTQGFKKDLEIQGLGYKANVEGKNVIFQIGFSHQINFPIPEGVKITIEKQTMISVTGVDKSVVGEVAASIRALKKPEPYKGTGIRYVGEHIIRKAGKAAAGSTGGKK
jgi:large subunit ribosomal protein L6